VPFGGAAAELFDVVLQPSLERRQEAWLAKLGEVVVELRKRQLDLADMVEDESFTTVAIQASRIALGTHLEEKLALLKACILNMAMPEAPDDFLALTFLRYVDELTPEHFLVLTYGRDPIMWFEQRGQKRNSYREASVRVPMMEADGLGASGLALDLILGDLSNRMLMQASASMTEHGDEVYRPLTTDLGNLLLDFVTVFE
jgi:hypothetical protein